MYVFDINLFWFAFYTAYVTQQMMMKATTQF